MGDTHKNWPVDPERIAKGLYWQEAWKLVEGCTPVSAACDNCWSARETQVRAGQANEKISGPKQGLLEGGQFNGKIKCRMDNLEKPLKTKKPMVFSVWNDLFHEDVPDEFIHEVFGTIRQTPQHIYLILTKRPERIRRFIAEYLCPRERMGWNKGFYSHVWFGVSVEDQKTADERIPLLLQVSAAKRFVSYEPALGPVDFENILVPIDHVEERHEYFQKHHGDWKFNALIRDCEDHYYQPPRKLDWVIMGGESGPGARPINPRWARGVRDQCQRPDVPFFFKQWGEWAETKCEPGGDLGGDMRRDIVRIVKAEGENDGHFRPGDVLMRRVGKKAAGCLLDGKEHKERP